MKLLPLILLVSMTGCRSTLEFQKSSLEQAQQLVTAGEYFKARQILNDVLSAHPQDMEAQRLMAEALSGEMARQKDAFEAKRQKGNPEKDEIRTLLERSELMRESGEYEEAMSAAEKIFLYDPENTKASRQIDKIREEMNRTGRSEAKVLQQIEKDDVRLRVDLYLQEARERMAEGHWAAAAFSIQKALLISPGDKEAVRLAKRIQQQEEKFEAGKAL